MGKIRATNQNSHSWFALEKVRTLLCLKCLKRKSKNKFIYKYFKQCSIFNLGSRRETQEFIIINLISMHDFCVYASLGEVP